jgi:uncharacterized protein HemY
MEEKQKKDADTNSRMGELLKRMKRQLINGDYEGMRASLAQFVREQPMTPEARRFFQETFIPALDGIIRRQLKRKGVWSDPDMRELRRKFEELAYITEPKKIQESDAFRAQPAVRDELSNPDRDSRSELI